MPLSSDDGTLFDPKWFVLGFAFIGWALIATYDLRLGIAAGAVLGTFVALWLYFGLRFGLIGGEDRPSYRRLMADRFRQQLRNRRNAEQAEDEHSGA
ncbi:MAG: hypothetical protein ACOVQY_02560 [Erythrobacter sp.]